ncbi:MAG: SRPBCC family protein [Aureispira sp.]
MDILFILLILSGFFFLAVMLGGLFLPATWGIEKAVLVPARPKELFPLLNELERWQEWTIWSPEEEDFSLTYASHSTGEGAIQIWKSKRINGRLTLTKSVVDQALEYRFEIDEGQLVVLGTLVLAAADPDYTQVAWRCQLDPLTGSNPIRRYQAYFLKNYFDTAMESSLAALPALFSSTKLD